MLAYPIHLEPDDNDTLLATSPDFPELTTFGNDRDDAIAHAVDALEEAISVRMRHGEDIPRPSQGVNYATLSTPTATKVMLYQEIRDHSLGKAEPERNLGLLLIEVHRTKDLNHRSWSDEWTPQSGPWAVSR